MWKYACTAALLLACRWAAAEEPEKFNLRYQFSPGETICWEVEHRSRVKAAVSGTTQTTETLSLSLKSWRIIEVQPDGTAVIEHSVPWVDMRQRLSDREEVRYDSRRGEKPPLGFEGIAPEVGVPLARLKIDFRGKTLHREWLRPKPPPQTHDWLTIPLPEQPVAVGEKWSLPLEIDVPLPSGGVKKIKALQQFTLEKVENGVAVIHFSTDILTPVTDPAIESQLVQSAGAGWARFDIDAGRILAQQSDIDKHVVGFRGEASSIHYVNRFAERLVSAEGAARLTSRQGETAH